MAAKKTRKPAIEKPEGIADDIIYPAIKAGARLLGRKNKVITRKTAAATIRSMDDRIVASRMAKNQKWARKNLANQPKAKTAKQIRKEIETGRRAVQHDKRLALTKSQIVKNSSIEKTSYYPPLPTRRSIERADAEARYVWKSQPINRTDGVRKVGGESYAKRVDEVTSSAKHRAYIKRTNAAKKSKRVVRKGTR